MYLRCLWDHYPKQLPILLLFLFYISTMPLTSPSRNMVISSCHLKTTEKYTRSDLRGSKIQKIFWGGMPPDPPRGCAATCSPLPPPPTHTHKFSLNIILPPLVHFSKWNPVEEEFCIPLRKTFPKYMRSKVILHNSILPHLQGWISTSQDSFPWLWGLTVAYCGISWPSDPSAKLLLPLFISLQSAYWTLLLWVVYTTGSKQIGVKVQKCEQHCSLWNASTAVVSKISSYTFFLPPFNYICGLAGKSLLAPIMQTQM